jgi:hypothetical protein
VDAAVPGDCLQAAFPPRIHCLHSPDFNKVTRTVEQSRSVFIRSITSSLRDMPLAALCLIFDAGTDDMFLKNLEGKLEFFADVVLYLEFRCHVALTGPPL